MDKKYFIFIILLIYSISVKAQIFNIEELNYLFNVPIKNLNQKINLKKWSKEEELRNANNETYLINYRYNLTTSHNKIKVVEYKKGPPKILIFMTADKDVIKDLDDKMKIIKYKLIDTNNKDGAINKVYLNGRYVYIFSKAVATSVFLITGSKEYLEDNKIKN